MGNNISIVCLLITDNSMPSSVWGLSDPNSSFFACSTKMEPDPVNIFPFASWHDIKLYRYRAPGGHCKRKRFFSSRSGVLLSPNSCSLWMLQCLVSNMDDFTIMQQPAASPTLLRHLSVDNSPSTPEGRSLANATGTAPQPTYPPSRESQPCAPNNEEGLFLGCTVSAPVVLAAPHTWYACVLYSPYFLLINPSLPLSPLL